MSTFLQRNTGAATNDIAGLRRARMVLANEGNQGQRLDMALVKAMTGGDEISARLLYKEFVSYKPEYKPVMVSNHLPELDATDPAIWRRLHILPFERVFAEHEQDHKLPEKLRSELPGILRWAVAGAVAWYEIGLSPPQPILDAVAAFHAEMDIVGAFLDYRCNLDPNAECNAGLLYAEFQAFAREAGATYISQHLFGRELGRRGFRERKTMGRIVRSGIALKPSGMAGSAAA